MPALALANPFLKRLPAFQTPASWRRIARNPSIHAPRPEDVQPNQPFTPPAAPPRSATEQTLLDAVLVNPDADGPRLAYAEQSPDRGDFIRTQLAIARELRAGDEPPEELFDRESALLAKHGDDWAKPLEPWNVKDLVYRRGFVERLSLSGRSFLSLGGPLFDFLPLRGVRLVAVKMYADELARCEHLARLSELDLTDNRIGADALRDVTMSPHARAITSWNLAGNDVTAEVLESLPAGTTRLGLAGGRLSAANLRRFESMTSLDVSGLTGPFGLPRGLRRLTASRCGFRDVNVVSGPNLQDLDVSFNDIGDDSFDSTLTSCPGLKRLSLRGCRLTRTSLRGSGGPRLRHLDLGANFFGDDLASFLVPERFPSLTSLDVTNGLLTDRFVDELCDSGLAKRLVHLTLAWNNLTDRAAKRLASCAALGELRTLDLRGTRVGRAGARTLHESPFLTELRGGPKLV
jgi:uncharacterized protein (TIGR02996 family)